MPILALMLSVGLTALTPDPKLLAKQSFDERLGAVHDVRACYYDKVAAAPKGPAAARAQWLRAHCAEAEASDVAVWMKWLPELKAQIPASAEHNHQAIAEEVASDPTPELGMPTS